MVKKRAHIGDGREVSWVPGIRGPGQIRARIREVNQYYQRLNRAIRDSQASASFKREWQAIYEDWAQFYADNMGWSAIFGSTFDEAEGHFRTAQRWQRSLEEQGRRLEGPAPREVERVNITIPESIDVGTGIKTGAALAGLGLAAYLIYKLK